MKTLTFVLLKLSLFLNIAASVQADQLPDIEAPETSFSYGTVAEGHIVEHDFTIKNTGNSNLDIQRLMPSCGCTASTIEKNLIGPGEQTKVKVSFNTRGFSGAKVKTVKLFSNDPDEPSLVLSLVGAIQQNITVEPQRLEFLKLLKGEETPANHSKIIVKTQEGTPVKLRKAISLSKYVKIVEKEISRFETEILVSIAPNAPEGELREKVILDLAGAPFRSINVPVYAQIKPSIFAEPKTVSFGLISGSQLLTKAVKISNIGSSNIKLDAPKVSQPEIQTELIEAQAGKNFILKVSIDPNKVTSDLKGQVTLDILPFANGVDRLESQKQSIVINVFAIAP